MLPAKSRRGGQETVTLEAHSRDTERAAVALFGGSGRWSQAFPRFFGLDGAAERHRLVLHLRVAALLHDVGKANEDFVAAVSGSTPDPQALRHEHLSALILCLPDVRAWLAACPELDVGVVTAAVLSHHLKASEAGDWKWCQPQRPCGSLPLFLDHPEVRAILDRVASVAGVGAPPALPTQPWGERAPWSAAYGAGLAHARAFRRRLRDGSDVSAIGRLAVATKAGLIAADAAASALVREGASIDDWIGEVVGQPDLSSTEIEREVVARRAADIEARTKQPFAPRAFQVHVAAKGPRVLLRAACASGKTLAAWKWAAARAEEGRIGRVVFLYPTRGTATEGFRDYVSWAPAAETALVTGTSRYELEAMAANPNDRAAARLPERDEADDRLRSLALWQRRWFSATVDQFLGFLEHQRSSICLLPVLADAAVIIDEVHSFDRAMFDGLVAFLQTFRGPVLCMTATIQPSRQAELEDAGLVVYPEAIDRAALEDLDRAERAPRYAVRRAAVDDALEAVLGAHAEGQRVLWVANTVARCQAMHARIESQVGPIATAYHSRFRLMDRRKVHDDVVARFARGASEGALAVTTQVCEMSLDLDADVLVTELAPIPALVQRMGRANRHLSRSRATVFVVDPPASAPYEAKDLEAARAFLSEVVGPDVCQRDLADALERHARDEREAAGAARFLESGWFATPGSFRGDDGFAETCVLDTDLSEIEARWCQHETLDGHVLSVPRNQLLRDVPRPDWLPRWLAIAPGARYDARRGFIAEEMAPWR